MSENEEVEFNLSHNELTKIINSQISRKKMTGYLVCVATHVKTGAMEYVVFCDEKPIHTSTSAEDISIFIDLMKFNDDCIKKEGVKRGKKLSGPSNSSRKN